MLYAAYIYIVYPTICASTWGFIKNPVLSITSSGEIGFWEHDIEASKMQGRARGRKGERKTYHITIYHHITMEFGGYSLNVAKKTTRARARNGEAQGVLSYQKATGIFDNPHIAFFSSISVPFSGADEVHIDGLDRLLSSGKRLSINYNLRATAHAADPSSASSGLLWSARWVCVMWCCGWRGGRVGMMRPTSDSVN